MAPLLEDRAGFFRAATVRGYESPNRGSSQEAFKPCKLPGLLVEQVPQGPGLARASKSLDAVSTTSIIFAVIGLIPSKWIGIGGFHAFGPLAFTAIFAIVGVLFGLLAIIRHGELQNKRAFQIGIAATALGLLRLFIYPLAGL